MFVFSLSVFKILIKCSFSSRPATRFGLNHHHKPLKWRVRIYFSHLELIDLVNQYCHGGARSLFRCEFLHNREGRLFLNVDYA